MRITVLSLLFFLMVIQPLTAQKIIPDAVISATATQTAEPVPGGYSGSVKYVRSFVPTKPISIADDITITSSVTDVQTQTTYLDGLGRPLQTVSKGVSPLGKDLVATAVYDEFGRESFKYLPYVSSEANGSFKTNPFVAQTSFMQTQHPGEQFFYGQTVFEASPLNRPVKTMAPGNSWAGSSRGVEMSYEINVLNEVRIWTIGILPGSIPASTTYYGAGELYRTVSKDEHGKRVVEYKDKADHVVLKKVEIGTNAPAVNVHSDWLCTYYVYDDFSNLRYVLSPKAVEQVVNSGVITNDVDKELCFRYEYDARNRMILKKVPGAAEVFMVYDARDRLVFSQDGNMGAKNWWMVNYYDAVNRPVATGMMTWAGSRESLQSHMNSSNFNNNSINVQGASVVANLILPQRNTNSITIYKASQSIEFVDGFESLAGDQFETEVPGSAEPPSTLEVYSTALPSGATVKLLTQTFYDDYSFTNKNYKTANNSKLDPGINLYPEALPASKSLATKGMTTGSRVWVIEDAANLSLGRWLETAIFYDDKGRPVQVQADNASGGLEEATSLYDFSGKVLSTYQVHRNVQSTTSELTLKTSLSYDAGGRLLTVKKAINDGTGKIILQNEYDESGQLKNKKLGNKPNSSNPLETLAYEYNIRGWLKGINQAYVNDPASSNYFGQSLSYDFGFANNSGTKNQYNGNISGVQWRSKGDGEQRAYGFEYDAANRLLKADFTQNNNGWNNNGGVDFGVGGNHQTGGTMKYDANGNIFEMWQKGLKLGSSGMTSDWIDQMSYTYFTNSNKLSAVTDAIIANNKLGDFTDKNIAGSDYGYDVNGNMLTDLNKKLAGATGIDQTSGGAIEYNHLNLPYKITVKADDGIATKGTITYIYDAAGNKLKKIVLERAIGNNPEKTTTTSYVGGFFYESSTGVDELQHFAHEEGRTRPVRDANNAITYVYDYFIKDHLGNVRMVLTEEQKPFKYPVATLEPPKTNIEKEYYSIADAQIQDVTANPVSGMPAYTNDNGIGNNPVHPAFEAANSTKLYRLNSNEAKTGLGITLKVMAGDKIDVFGKSYYFQNNPGSGSTNTLLITDLISGFLGSAGGIAASGAHGGITMSQINTAGGLPGINNMISQQSSQSDGAPDKPRAFINVIFFDEQFKSYEGGYKVSMVGSNSVMKDHFSELQNLLAAKSGYVYIYCSNETPINVFFDNVQVVHTPGPILEETHYYPFGLTMAGISFKAAGIEPNKEKTFQDQRFDNDLGLNWVQFKWRNHDPQTGRFIEIDPLANDYVYNSVYAFSENKVTAHVELEGLESASIHVVQSVFNKIIELGTDMPNGAAQLQQGAINKAEVVTGGNANLPQAVQQLKSVSAELQINAGVAQMVKPGMEMALMVGSATVGVEFPTSPSLVTGMPVLKQQFSLSPSAAFANVNEVASQASAALNAMGQSPAGVVAMSLPDGTAVSVATSGFRATNVAPQWAGAVKQLGGLGTKVNGNTVGACAEFNAGNQLLLANPSVSPSQLVTSDVYRPRTSALVPTCQNCQTLFSKQ